MTENPYKLFCEQREKDRLLRHITETRLMADGYAERDGKALVNFAGNDYLGLARHPALIARAQEYAARYGTGNGASRLVTGSAPPYAAIEERLARGKNCEAALIMNSGYQANLTVLAALADVDVVGRPVTIVADRLCHNSLLQGALLSNARLVRYQHNDMNHLDDILRQTTEKGSQAIVVTESVFSMDGDRVNMPVLIDLKRRHGAMLYVDEAHATGLFGPGGFGFSALYPGDIDIAMGTFGKALGGFGAYIGCSAVLRDYLVQRCGGLIYSTALPPAVLGSIDMALELLPSLEQERAQVQENAENLRGALRGQGWDCGASTTQIIPVILGREAAALELSAALEEAGLLAIAIRPPTVPRGSSRLRISVSAAHRAEDIDRLIEAMADNQMHATRALAS